MRTTEPRWLRTLVIGLALLVAAQVEAGTPPASIVLRWKPVPGAAEYELEISRDRAFHQLVTRERVKGAGYRWNALTTTEHFWRVRSIERDGRLGKWSSVESISAAVQPPTLARPEANGTVRTGDASRPLELAAEPSQVLRAYEFQLSADPSFAGAESIPATGAHAELPMPAPGTWHFRARGVDVAGRTTGWSELRRFHVVLGSVRATAPSDGSVIELRQLPTIVSASWPAVSHAASYALELSLEGGATRVQETKTTEAKLELRQPGRYRVRIAAVDATGARADFGPSQRFEVKAAPPSWRSPAPDATVRATTPEERIALAFEGVARDGFRIEVAPDEAFTGPVQSFEATTSPAQVKLDAGRHFARVVARFGEDSVVGPVLPFRVELAPQLAAPVAQAPRSAVVGETPIQLAWSAVNGAVTYELALADNVADALERPTLHRLDANRYALPASSEGERVWRVRAVDAQGTLGPWSEVQHLLLERPRPQRVVPTLDQVSHDQARLLVRLLDAEGRAIEGLSPTVSASIGRLDRVEGGDGAYQRRLFVPAGFAGPVELTIVDRGRTFHERVQFVPPRARLSAGGRLGFANNFAAVNAPFVLAEVTWRSPLLRDRLWASARVGVYGAAMRLPESLGLPVPLAASAMVVPASALVLYAHPRWGFDFYGGAGPSLSWVRVQVGDEWESGAALGAMAVLGAVRPLWRGEASVELQLGFGQYDTAFARLGTGGVGLSFGYRFGLR